MPFASFTHSGGSITFTRAPLRPDLSLDIIQPQRQSAGGTRFGYYPTVTDDLIKLKLRLTGAERDQLRAFFGTIVTGQSDVFTYTDVLGVAHTVRFSTQRLDNLTEKAYGSWEAQLELRVVA